MRKASSGFVIDIQAPKTMSIANHGSLNEIIFKLANAGRIVNSNNVVVQECTVGITIPIWADFKSLALKSKIDITSKS